MGSVGNSLITGIAPGAIVAELDRLYAYELIAVTWAITVRSQLAGPASFLLGEELDALIEKSLSHARTLADRAGQLGGSVNGDPSGFIARSPLDRFALPVSTSNPGDILSYALEQIRLALRAYGALLTTLAGKDEVTHHTILHILRDHVDLEDEIEAALTP